MQINFITSNFNVQSFNNERSTQTLFNLSLMQNVRSHAFLWALNFKNNFQSENMKGTT